MANYKPIGAFGLGLSKNVLDLVDKGRAFYDPKAFGKKDTKRAPKTLGKKPQNPKKRAGKGFGRTRETKGCL